MEKNEIIYIFKKEKINKHEKAIRKNNNIEIAPAEGSIYVQKSLYSGLYIIRRIIGIIKCFSFETQKYNTRFVIVTYDYQNDFTNNKTALVIVDSFTGVILEGYAVPSKPDIELLDTVREILKVNYTNLFQTSIKRLSKLFQVNKPYLEN